jgi:flavorubredoxin
MSAIPISAMTLRDIAPGVTWLSACLVLVQKSGDIHVHASTYLVIGEEKSMLVDAGHPRHRDELLDSLDRLLDGRPLDYVFPTHTEMPHAGNLRFLVERYPDIGVCGDIRDYHLYWPQLADNLVPLAAGESIDLGGTRLTAVEAVIRDLPNTMWAYDERSGCLFVGDALAYSHEHGSGECTLVSEELPQQPSVAQIGVINDAALYFTRYVDLEPYFARLDEVMAEHPTRLIAPAHGGVISDPAVLVPTIKDGMRAGREAARAKMAA